MALRTFRSNPSLGGFGAESSSGPMAAAGRRGHPPTSAQRQGGANVDSRITPTVVVSKDCCDDAFGQIIKELVDNAVDACSTSNSNNDEAKRVRVVIEREAVVDDDVEFVDMESGTRSSEHILRVTVSDNGIGMENIQECVEAFRTSKGAGSSCHTAATSTNDSNHHEETPPQQDLTAGRYGIGLTLCLVHAQRLVENSCASITSATSSASQFTRASYVVDTNEDSIKCVKKELLPKNFPQESGTAVSLLVPGGPAAHRAWPRLAEYFARFQLSLGLCCSLEVMAPCLSAVPLFVRPPVQKKKVGPTTRETDRGEAQPSRAKTRDDDDEEQNTTTENSFAQQLDEEQDGLLIWTGGGLEQEDEEKIIFESSPPILLLDKEESDDASNHRPETTQTSTQNNNSDKISKETTPQEEHDERRRQLVAAAASYLKRSIQLKNVAHSLQPIRRETTDMGMERPMLEVDMVVYGPEEEEEAETDEDDVDSLDDYKYDGNAIANQTAKLMLIRLVNRIPLLDGAEASACGLVQGLYSKQATWNSFGLHVTLSNDRNGAASADSDVIAARGRRRGGDIAAPSSQHLFVPTYAVRDSDQVAPFFQTSTHSQFHMYDSDDEDSDDSEDDDEREEDDWEESPLGRKRKRRDKQHMLLPAHLRLGNILVIAQIHAEPSSLPLPTLSKGLFQVATLGPLIEERLRLVCSNDGRKKKEGSKLDKKGNPVTQSTQDQNDANGEEDDGSDEEEIEIDDFLQVDDQSEEPSDREERSIDSYVSSTGTSKGRDSLRWMEKLSSSGSFSDQSSVELLEGQVLEHSGGQLCDDDDDSWW